MKEYNKALYSRFVVNGVELEATPYELLAECSLDPEEEISKAKCEGKILDEQLDPPLSSHIYSDDEFNTYLSQTYDLVGKERNVPICYSESYTRIKIATALTGTLWNGGHYKSGNIALDTCWTWNDKKIGNMAAFYTSVYAANEYIFDLNVKIRDFDYKSDDSKCRLAVNAAIISGKEEDDTDSEEMALKESPYKSRHAWTDGQRCCPEHIVEDEESWIIYIPFDTCSLKLGGSLLAQTCNHSGEAAPDMQDPDYTIDCYEVVRELVEDKIITAGITVADGGLACALKTFCNGYGMEIGLGGLKASYPEASNTHLLFSEVPGVLIQIRDIDYDYVDSQLLLQDVAYYPLGHPDLKSKKLRIAESNDSDVFGILKSLLDQASEGED